MIVNVADEDLPDGGAARSATTLGTREDGDVRTARESRLAGERAVALARHGERANAGRGRRHFAPRRHRRRRRRRWSPSIRTRTSPLATRRPRLS